MKKFAFLRKDFTNKNVMMTQFEDKFMDVQASMISLALE
ncbi:hypothetical protein HMPREF9960_0343 [Streptococcus cristatus ATCC 51100]|uniref:Uncharacterized protein n=1 Tax=Streptococcus cristatus ATCC 51100 TaxID=889201 RepID=A0AAV3EHF7_STRCR|nr:hypothetical protein HMPREF9960_0343 [Streptococcus cristatus ATCC 51100]